MTKSGENYKRPLEFVIKDNKGNTYSASSEDQEEESEGNETPTGEYRYKDTYTSYGVRNGGRQAWRVPKNGPAFGNKIKVVFSNGHTVFVNNTSQNYRESDGFVFKPGLGNNTGSDGTGTTHHGVYLHAPYGNSSKTVTVYYSGK
jgi:hypothetical protein